jgi:hypothetical protein
MSRYCAKLLFQFRVLLNGPIGKRRTCEERIILIEARRPNSALAAAKRIGRSAQFEYENSDGNKVFFEFIGVMDLLHLSQECERDEVWYEIKEHLLPMERKDRLIPPERELRALKVVRDRPAGFRKGIKGGNAEKKLPKK